MNGSRFDWKAPRAFCCAFQVPNCDGVYRSGGCPGEEPAEDEHAAHVGRIDTDLRRYRPVRWNSICTPQPRLTSF